MNPTFVQFQNNQVFADDGVSVSFLFIELNFEPFFTFLQYHIRDRNIQHCYYVRYKISL